MKCIEIVEGDYCVHITMCKKCFEELSSSQVIELVENHKKERSFEKERSCNRRHATKMAK
jgi:hypothetical protein